MVKREHLRELAKISKQIGENPAYVQGGGGNTSVKFGDKQMAVKSSGLTLKEVTEIDGYSVVDFKAINSYLNNPDEDENDFTQKIRSFVIETDNRPSIETGFHALLGIYVIHTHSVYVNVLTCSVEGREILNRLFPQDVWVDYKTPGKELTIEIKNKIRTSGDECKAVFLQNHGLIVWEKTADQVFNIHEEISNKIRQHLDLIEFDVEEETNQLLNIHDSNILFPDQVIYTMAGEDILSTQGAKETISAYSYILSNIKMHSLTPRFVSKNESKVLLGMESEKFRQKVIKDEIH